MRTAKTIGKEFYIYSVSGKVVDSAKRFETQVSGGIGGGFTEHGSTYTAPMTLSARPYLNDSILLQDSDGKEHTIKLINQNIPRRAGNQLTAVWALRKRRKRTPIAIVNHTLSRVNFNETVVFFMMAPHWAIMVGLLILSWAVKSQGMAILFIGVWLAIGFFKSRELKKDIERYYGDYFSMS